MSPLIQWLKSQLWQLRQELWGGLELPPAAVAEQRLPTSTLDVAALLQRLQPGQLCEIVGAPQSGKTSLALLLMAALQQQAPRAALFIDLSDSLAAARARLCGVCVQHTWILRRRDVAAVMATLQRFLHCQPDIGVLVIDALEMLEPRPHLAWSALQHILHLAQQARCYVLCTTDLAAHPKPLSLHATQRLWLEPQRGAGSQAWLWPAPLRWVGVARFVRLQPSSLT